MLAVQFGLKRFHQYIHGQTITVETDHKPLLGIPKESLNKVSPRIQRMRLRCLRYHYNLQYRPGRDMVLAALSRASQQCYKRDMRTSQKTKFRQSGNRQFPPQWDSLGAEKQHNKTHLTSHTKIRNSRLATWPSTAFWTVRHNLTEKHGIVFKGSQAVVPTALRRSVPESIHDGHFGIVKCLERAKNSVY